MFITIIAIGIEAPDPTVQVSTTVGFASAFGSVTNIIFAYAGHVAFFSFMSELEDPNQYMKALFTLQGADISLYLLAAIVIYRYGGPDVSSPSLGSTSPVVQKVAYGIALPTVGNSLQHWEAWSLSSHTDRHRWCYQRSRSCEVHVSPMI